MSSPTVLFLFDTTHHALWAEQIATRLALAAQVVPAPADSDAKCDLAIEVLAEDAKTLEDALTAEGVLHRIRR